MQYENVIGRSIYTASTHINRYLNAISHNYPAQKCSVLDTLINRAHRILSEDSWDEKKIYFKSTLTNNGAQIFTKLSINK